ncbi:UNVERIFIED_CONTAM: hypothetical protein K2H54_005588 [Gekko kuhli]
MHRFSGGIGCRRAWRGPVESGTSVYVCGRRIRGFSPGTRDSEPPPHRGAEESKMTVKSLRILMRRSASCSHPRYHRDSKREKNTMPAKKPHSVEESFFFFLRKKRNSSVCNVSFQLRDWRPCGVAMALRIYDYCLFGKRICCFSPGTRDSKPLPDRDAEKSKMTTNSLKTVVDCSASYSHPRYHRDSKREKNTMPAKKPHTETKKKKKNSPLEHKC